MKPSKTTYKSKTTVIAVVIVFSSLRVMCQNTQDCTYGTQLNKIDHFLDSLTATRWINHYQQYVDSVTKGLAKFDPHLFPKSQESFNRLLMQKILDLAGCIGERVFVGINENQQMVAILGGIDNCGNTLYITDDEQTLRMNNNGGSDVRTLRVSNFEGGKGLGEFGQYP